MSQMIVTLKHLISTLNNESIIRKSTITTNKDNWVEVTFTNAKHHPKALDPNELDQILNLVESYKWKPAAHACGTHSLDGEAEYKWTETQNNDASASNKTTHACIIKITGLYQVVKKGS